MRSSAARAPLLQLGGRLRLGQLQGLGVEQHNALEADAQQSGGALAGAGAAVQQFLNLKESTPVRGQASACLGVQLLQLLFALVDRRVKEFSFLFLFGGGDGCRSTKKNTNKALVNNGQGTFTYVVIDYLGRSKYQH